MATVNEYMKDFIAHVDQYCQYIDGAIASPDLADFEVITKKSEFIYKQITFMETLIGVNRKEPHAGRENHTPTKDAQGKAGLPKRGANPAKRHQKSGG